MAVTDTLRELREQVEQNLSEMKDTAALDALRVKVLGKKGTLTELLKGMGKLAPVPAFLQRQRRVGVVFFHRVAQQLCFRRQRGETAQRIQIAQQKIRRKPALPKPVVTAVRGDQQVAFGRCKAAGRKISRTDDITGLHGFGSLRSWVVPL